MNLQKQVVQQLHKSWDILSTVFSFSKYLIPLNIYKNFSSISSHFDELFLSNVLNGSSYVNDTLVEATTFNKALY